MDGAGSILEIRDLTVEYLGDRSNVLAVDRVSLQLDRGRFLGLVGESGCGKSTLLFAIARLLTPPAEITAGDVVFKGENIVLLREKQLRRLRWRDYSVVFQSAMNALNPVMTIGNQFVDAMQAHDTISRRACRERGAEVLRLVGIDPVHLDSYPHQLSGGMRQRAMIAMALVFSPDLIIMDEPTSALDVVAQRSLMLQIKQLQEQFSFAVIFVTHDISLLRNFADRLAVMYAGQIVEMAPTTQVFTAAKHPYTDGLLKAFPSIYGEKRELTGIPGSPPDLRHPPAGCRFHPRCPYVTPYKREVEPVLREVEPGHLVACHLYGEAQGR